MATLFSSGSGRSTGVSGWRAWVALAGFLVGPLAIGSLGGVVTANAVEGWYSGVRKPSWNPPSWVFGPVWTVLYLLMGVAAWRVWRKGSGGRGTGVNRALGWFAFQLALNAAWSPVFFGLKQIGLALAVIVAMVGAISETARRFARVDRTAGVLLVPYLAWVAFATVLNWRIWQLNR